MRESIDARSSARWVSVSQAARSLIQLTAVMVLARLLTPAEYGLMALANIVAGLAYSLRDFGTTPAVIRRPTLDPSFESAVFWLNLTVGVVLSLLVLASAWPLTRYFDAPDLSGVLVWLSPLFLVGSLSILPQAKLERAARFRQLAIIEVVAAAAGALVAIGMALWGAGVYSLVMQAHLPVWITSACLLVVSDRTRPRTAGLGGAMRELLQTSVPMTLYAILTQLRAGIDSFVIGRLFGAHWLGSYSVASKVALTPMANLSAVCGRAALPSYSAALQDTARLREMYLRSIRLVAFISFPAMATLWTFRQVFADLALGSQWSDAVPILAWLAPIGALGGLEAPTASVLIAQGRARVLSRLTLLAAILVGLGLVVGGQFGISPMMGGLFVATLISVSVSMVMAGRALGLRLSAPFVALLPSLLLAVVSVLVMKMVENQLVGMPLLLRVALSLAAGVAAYFVLARWVARSTASDLMSLVPGLHRSAGGVSR
ncbi:MAG: lipopolysaccharide biosynthesis protein [Burkholderiaceae bacterium]